jgi:hypothetical protein
MFGIIKIVAFVTGYAVAATVVDRVIGYINNDES